MADATRKEFIDRAKSSYESNDVHMARCYCEGLIRAIAGEGKVLMVYNEKDNTLVPFELEKKK